MSLLAEGQSGLIDGEAVSHFEPQSLRSRALQICWRGSGMEAAVPKSVNELEAPGK